MENFLQWVQERRRRNLEPAAMPSPSDFTTIESMEAGIQPGPNYIPRIGTEKHIYDQAAHEEAKKRWAFKEDLRLKGRERLAKLANMNQNVAQASSEGFSIKPPEGISAAGSAPLDVLDPSVKTMADFEAKRNNMFRYGGLV